VVTDIAPFTFVENYAWETVARYIVENVATELDERVDFDSEHSMFCAFSADRAALEALGARLARLFHDRRALTKIIDTIGVRGFALFGE
jgi:Immunity protein 51